MPPTLRTVPTPQGEVTYELTRKAVKNLNLRIRPDGSVAVSAPRRVPLAELDAFVLRKAAYIHQAQARFQALAQRPPRPRLHEPAVFQEILDELYPRLRPLGVPYPQLRLRTMKSRWGSCLVYKNTITLNTKLLEQPRRCVEYVVLHELCHFLHPNHSPAFYACLESFMPDWRERREALNAE